MAAHKSFTVATDMRVYFCDPHSPWQRGSNENTNGLLRQYFPKGEDLSSISQKQLDEVAMRLNQRPRKTLDFATPAYIFAQSVASTGLAGPGSGLAAELSADGQQLAPACRSGRRIAQLQGLERLEQHG